MQYGKERTVDPETISKLKGIVYLYSCGDIVIQQ